MIWAAMFWYSAGFVITRIGRITANEYVDILGNQVNPMVQMLFHNHDATFQDDNSPIHVARNVVLVWGAWRCTSASFLVGRIARIKYHRTTVPLLSVLESRVRIWFPPPPSLKQLEDVFREERYSIPLEIIQILYESIPRRIQSDTKKGNFWKTQQKLKKSKKKKILTEIEPLQLAF